MATPEELKRQQEENALLERENRILRERLELQNESYSLSTAYLESLKEVLGIRSRTLQYENDTLDINKKIQKAIKDQNVELELSSDKLKQINKNEEILRKAKLTITGLQKSFTAEQNKQIDKTTRAVQLQNNLTKEIENELKKTEKGLPINQQLLDSKKAQLNAVDREVERRIGLLQPLEKQLLYTKLTSEELEKQNNERTKELGKLGKIVAHLEKLPIIGDTMKSVSTFMAGGLAGLAIAAAFLIKAISQADNKITDLQKSFGITRGTARGISLELEKQSIVSGDIFITSKKLNQSFRELSAELGFAADISGQTLETFTNLTQRLGLSTKEATQLTYLARLQGENTETTLNNASKTVSALNRQKGTSINIKAVFNDIANASAATVVSLGGSVEALTEASTKARQLGLTLSEVDQVASSLLDFQTSIENELAAELLTGKQINLEAARYYALVNDTAKLTEEIGNNQELINAFASNNRLAQEASAKALGMSREELGKMVMNTQLLALGAEGFRAKFGEANYEQMQALSIGDRFKATLEKIQEIIGNIGYAFEPVLNMLASLTSNAGVLYSTLGLIAAIAIPKMIIGLGQAVILLGTQLGLINAGTMAEKRQTVVLMRNLGISRAEAIAKLASSSAASFGLATLGIIAAVAAGAAAIDAFTADDMVSTGYGKRMLYDKGAIISLNDNDKIVATTNDINPSTINPRTRTSTPPTQTVASQPAPTQQTLNNKVAVEVNYNGRRLSNLEKTNQNKIGSGLFNGIDMSVRG
jgi:hypothetical protein